MLCARGRSLNLCPTLWSNENAPGKAGTFRYAKCNRLAREFPAALRDKNLRDLAAELEQQIHELDHPIAKGPSADR
jgi:hypothetical protein